MAPWDFNFLSKIEIEWYLGYLIPFVTLGLFPNFNGPWGLF